MAHFGRGNKSLVSYEKEEMFVYQLTCLLVGAIILPSWYHFVSNVQLQFHSASITTVCTCITYETVDICFFELQEQLLLEPMFEVPGSDIVRVLVEEDTARGYHPARYQYNDPSSSEETKADQPPADESSPDSNSEIKTSVL